MDAKQLAARPSLEQYRKQAKDLFRTRRLPEAIGRIKRFHPRLAKLNEAEISDAKFSLVDAQWVVAREHAFESWPRFVRHIQELLRRDSPVSRFELAADAIVTGDLNELNSLLGEEPALVRARSTRSHEAPLIHYVSANGIEDFRQKTPKNIVKITTALLDAGADVDAISPAYGGSSTALGLAATSYHPAKAGVQLELLDALLAAGACVDGAPGGWSPLVAALHNGRGDAATFLATRGARLDLEGAAGAGRVDELSSFINEDGSLNAGATKEQLNYGCVWACEYGHTNVVGFLLDRNFKPDRSFTHGETGLHWAAYGGHLEIVGRLLKANWPVNVKDKIHGGTPLGWAIYAWSNPAPEFRNARHHEVVELLVSVGSIVDWDWINSPNRGSSLGERLRADSRMMTSLRG